MNSESKLAILCLKQLTSNNQNQEIESLIRNNKINWDEFKEFINYHEISVFIYIGSKGLMHLLPSDLAEFLKNNYYCALARCQRIWEEFLSIRTAFNEAKVDILPIKGVSFLEDIYSSYPCRMMTDIDLLVKEDQIRAAEEIFCNSGYRKELYGLKEEYWRDKQCHITFYNNKDKRLPFVELHWGIDFKRNNKMVLSEIWDRVREVKVNDELIKVLSPEDAIFSLALHNRRFGKIFCLKNVFDLILLIKKYKQSFDWGYCLSNAKKYRLGSTLFFILYQAKLLFELNIPKYIWDNLNDSLFKTRLMHRFIEKNIFLLPYGGEKNLYLKSHFLLYDSFWEPIKYIIDIPQEQFAKFYGLEPYVQKTSFLYRHRFSYMAFERLINGFTGKANKRRNLKIR